MSAQFGSLFGDETSGSNNGAAGESDDASDEVTPAEEMRAAVEVGGEVFQTYLAYEQIVDMVRFTNAAQAHPRVDEAAKDAMQTLLSNELLPRKGEWADETADLEGNLPTFREAFPVRERDGYGDTYTALDEDLEHRFEIGESNGEDPIVLPVNAEVGMWTPEIGVRALEAEGGEQASESDDTDDTEGLEVPEGAAVMEFDSMQNAANYRERNSDRLHERDDARRKTVIVTDPEANSEAESTDESDEAPEGGDDDDSTEESTDNSESATTGDVASEKAKLVASLREKVDNGESLTDAEATLIANL